MEGDCWKLLPGSSDVSSGRVNTEKCYNSDNFCEREFGGREKNSPRNTSIQCKQVCAEYRTAGICNTTPLEAGCKNASDCQIAVAKNGLNSTKEYKNSIEHSDIGAGVAGEAQ